MGINYIFGVVGLENFYSLFKSLHIIGFTSWFAGLFYLVRIFVYNSESKKFSGEVRETFVEQYNLMQHRVFSIICTPAMVITVTFGLLMIVSNGLEWFKFNYWLHYKLLLLLGLLGYHFYCKKIINSLDEGKVPMKPFQFRLFNEVPTVFLVLIVLLAVYKNSLNWVYTFFGMAMFISFMILAAKLYKKRRASQDK